MQGTKDLFYKTFRCSFRFIREYIVSKLRQIGFIMGFVNLAIYFRIKTTIFNVKP